MHLDLRQLNIQAIAMLALVAFLGGCTAPEVAHDDEDTGPTTITDPRNVTLDGRPHVHDYWNGAYSIELARVQWNPSAATSNGMEIRPEEGTGVIPGTRWINITVEFSGATTAGGEPSVQLRWNDALGDQYTADRLLKSGETYTIQTNESTNDPPHTLLSRWKFNVGFGSLTEAEIEAVIVIERPPGDLPIAPPHPDHWVNQTQIIIGEQEGPIFDYPFVPGTGPSGPVHRPPQPLISSIVPPATAQVVVMIHYNSSTPESLHYDPILEYHGADSREFQVLDREDLDGAWKWVIDVAPEEWDSPYANDTLWMFDMNWYGDIRAPHRAMDGDYHTVITAIRDPT